MLNTQPGEYVITITDCNSITEALITLRRGALNIKYGPNGTGKSTIARALVLNAQGADSLRELLPFKYRQGGNGKAPAVSGAAQIKNVLIFDEHYVSQFVFQPDEVVKNSFEIFVKTPDFVKGIEELESIFEDLKTSIGCCRQVGRVDRVRWRARGSGRSQGSRSAPRRGLTLTAAWASRMEEGSAISRTLGARIAYRQGGRCQPIWRDFRIGSIT